MHAYLIVGEENQELENSVKILAKKLKATLLAYPLVKIEDVRELNSFTALKVTAPTAIYIKGIEGGTPEALNAFLKNLEEPQENLYYILTTPSVKKVLPTIVSRCQVIKTIYNSQFTINKEVEEFLKMTIGEKFSFLDKIKEREKAVEFIEEFIKYSHQKLHGENESYENLSKNLVSALATLKALKANGNVNLQLTNFVVKLDN